MNQKLIPIIAAYWGAECSWISPYGHRNTVKGTVNHFTMPFVDKAYNFKLHLRPLWSITEQELRELAIHLKTGYVKVVVTQTEKRLDKNIYDNVFYVDNDGYFNINLSAKVTIQAINHLRAKGFCLDQELVDAGLVEWK